MRTPGRTVLLPVLFLVAFGGYSLKVKRDLLKHDSGTSRFKLGDEAPDFVLPRLGGGEVDLPEVVENHRLVIVNFWATWCVPCRLEMPMLENLYEKHREQGLEILAITSEDPAAVEIFLEGRDDSFPVLIDSGGLVAERYGVEVLPTTFLLGEGGRIRNITEGIDQTLQYVVPVLLNPPPESDDD